MHPSFEFNFRDETLSTSLISFHLNEMLATKMRALFQRRKGRDLFDLHAAITRGNAEVLSLDAVIAAFQHYMRAEKTRVPRSEFIGHLQDCLRDRTGFCTDLNGFLRQGEKWDPDAAGMAIEQQILARLPE